MAASHPTWAVVATVDEPPALVQAFAAWHLHLGAAAIYLYCDSPDDPVAGLLAHLPQVKVVVCDAAHWLGLGHSRPERHEVRQVRNANDAYVRCAADWLVHIDADEFLWPQTTVNDVLSGVGPDADGVVVQVAERMHRPGAAGQSIFEGGFRRPFRAGPREGRRLFGADYALTDRGLSGHSVGKSFARVGRGLQMAIHRPKPPESGLEIQIVRPAPASITLLHFDGLTPAHWTYKIARMVQALMRQDGMPPTAHRQAQAADLIANLDQSPDLYQRLKRADVDLIARLSTHGLWLMPDFDPGEALSRFFPDQAITLHPDAFDDWLAQTKPQPMAFLRSLQI